MATQDSRKFSAKLAGKKVLVIGGSSGIGFGVAEGAVEFGADVTIASSSAARVQAAVDRLLAAYPSAQGRVRGEVANLADDDVEATLEALFAKIGPLNHVVYTAGDKLALMPLASASREAIAKAGVIRFQGPLLMAKVATKYLAKSRESSITLTSGSIAEKPRPDWSVVASYAKGLYGMTQNLALDLKPIRVNCVVPGVVDTELWAGMVKEQYEDMKKGMEQNLLFTGKVPTPDDVAEAYLYLMRDNNITGVKIVTDGGASLQSPN